MLSQEERRELAAIERMLTAEDPDLARTLSTGEQHIRTVVQRAGWLLLALVLMVAAASGLGLLLWVVGVLALLAAAAPQPVLGGWSALRTRRSEPRRR